MQKQGWSLDFDAGCYKRYALVYILRGAGTYTDHQGNKTSLKAGDLFRRDSIYAHTLYIDPDSNWLECYLTITRPSNTHDDAIGTLRLLGLLPNNSFVKHIGIKLDIIEEFYQLSQKIITGKSERYFFQCQSELLALAVKLWNSEFQESSFSRESVLVNKVKDTLESSFAERTTVQELLTDIGTGYSNIRRIFTEETGSTPGRFRINLRLNYACELLITTDNTLAQIADKLGYHDQFIFSRQFKKTIGITPSKYRKRHQLYHKNN